MGSLHSTDGMDIRIERKRLSAASSAERGEDRLHPRLLGIAGREIGLELEERRVEALLARQSALTVRPDTFRSWQSAHIKRRRRCRHQGARAPASDATASMTFPGEDLAEPATHRSLALTTQMTAPLVASSSEPRPSPYGTLARVHIDLNRPAVRQCAGALVVLMTAAATASADEARPKVRLEVHRAPAADACAGEVELAQAVAERLGYDPFDGGAGEVVRVSIAPRGGELVARIERLDAAGTGVGARELGSKAPDCNELSASVALAISIALDPSRVLVASPPPAVAAESAPSSVPPASPPPPPPWRQAVRPRHLVEARTVRVSAGADAHGAVGSAPAPALGFGVHGDVRFGHFEVGLEGRADLPASTRAAHGGEVSGQVLFASLVPCAGFGWFLGCAVASAGALLGSAADSPTGTRAATPFAGAGLRAAIDLPVGARFALRPYVEAEAALARTTLVYGARDAWRAPPVFASGGVVARVALF
jgi:hypothetical protein